MFPDYINISLTSFNSMDTCRSQDAMLHVIFASIVRFKDDLSDDEIVEAITSLYRLYVISSWTPARTYLLLLTNILMDIDNPRIKCKHVTLDAETLHMRKCEHMGHLCFESEMLEDDGVSTTLSETSESEDEEPAMFSE